MRLHDFFEFHARENPDAPFASSADRDLTWGAAAREARQIGHALRAAGLGRGDRVAILAKNCVEYALFYYGAAEVGAVTVPVNYRLTAPEWQVILDDAGPKALLARGELVAAVAPLRTQLPDVGCWVALAAPAEAGWISYADWIGAQPSTPPEPVVTANDDLYQMYTSGTTGRPKGAVLTHDAVCTNVDQTSSVLPLSPGERYLIVAPMYHAAAAVAVFLTVRQGGTLVIMEDFDPQSVVDALSEQRINATTLVPAMIQACLVLVPGVEQRSYEHLRCIGYGASPIAAQTLRHAIDVFDCQFVQGYGMTECTALATALTPQDHVRALAGEPGLLLSCGRALPGTEVRVVDADDRDTGAGQIGEVLVRGPQVMRYYWRMPEASAAALAGDWLHTGDAGCLDAEGFLYIQDRVKDMIVSGGENIYPREVENVLFEHPGVADAAVIGIPDDRWGETVKAVVVLRDGCTADEAALIEFCHTRIAAFKCPQSVDFTAELPRNASGKVLKKDLRAPFWAGRTRHVG
ncbi:MAG: long-chain-fatty-acid--CoA ligase [Mycobacterium sp.]